MSWSRTSNDSANVQGTGTTIVQITPAGNQPVFFQNWNMADAARATGADSSPEQIGRYRILGPE